MPIYGLPAVTLFGQIVILSDLLGPIVFAVSLLLKTALICKLGNKQEEINCLIIFLTVLTHGEFCCLLMIFANSLDPDQDRQNVGPDLDPNHLQL